MANCQISSAPIEGANQESNFTTSGADSTAALKFKHGKHITYLQLIYDNQVKSPRWLVKLISRCHFLLHNTMTFGNVAVGLDVDHVNMISGLLITGVPLSRGFITTNINCTSSSSMPLPIYTIITPNLLFFLIHTLLLKASAATIAGATLALAGNPDKPEMNPGFDYGRFETALRDNLHPAHSNWD